jgi:hypothetical protein
LNVMILQQHEQDIIWNSCCVSVLSLDFILKMFNFPVLLLFPCQ